MVLQNNAAKVYVLSGFRIAASATVTLPNERYLADEALRWEINRLVARKRLTILSGSPAGFPVATGRDGDGDWHVDGISDDGKFYLPGLPTADPAVAGQVWNNAGTLKVSAG